MHPPVTPTSIGALMGQLGVGGIFAILILKTVFAFIKSRKTGGFTNEDIKKVLDHNTKMTEDLHEWHDMHDDDGVKIWYVRKSLQESVSKLADSIALLNLGIRDISLANKQQIEMMGKIVESINKRDGR